MRRAGELKLYGRCGWILLDHVSGICGGNERMAYLFYF